MLQIRLLGQFDVRLDGKRVTIPTRIAQSLLAYLALTTGTSHRREKLAGMFWPDTTEEIARKNLRQELWRIRKAISAGQSAEGDYLLADDLTLKFNREAAYWLDVAQMERPDLDLQALLANLSLYQGELLPGFYDEWITLERERINAIFDARMEALLEGLITAERWIAVQEWGERWLSLSGVREPAYRALMLASAVRGDMAKVASLYQRCTDELMESLGVKPSPETRALYNDLLKRVKIPLRATAAQPSGTITFLFTDIEGSTRLLEMMGTQYAVALSEHHEIMRATIQKWNGREVDTQGDAFFVTFSRALDAVQCAAEAQRALTSHRWPQDESLRVRMGLHTGEPLIASTGYVGMDVHRAARIGDAGHGGQILLSQTTRELIIQDLPKGMTIRDLGEHRLKDMKYPASIYQLVIEGLSDEFAPIRTKFTGAEAPTPGEAPFKGLEFFDVEDSDLFFGRETLTAKLWKRLQEAKFLSIIIGASGSGKSSLVRAGLVPVIKKRNADWHVHIITPTSHPLEALAIELTRDSESVTAAATLVDDLSKDPRSLHFFLSRRAQIDNGSHTLLVIDQFEELFTLCRDEFEREAFIDNLLTALSPSPLTPLPQGEGKLTLIITLRADFYAYLAQYPELRDAVAQQQEYIGPMTAEELRSAIEEPARRGHWEFEPGLVDLILRDVGDEPGALPLLSHALLETWKRRAGHMLTLKGYADAGGVHGAIAHTAETLYQTFTLDEQAIMRNILLRLTEFGEGTEDTRRRASFDELMSQAKDADEVRAVLNRLAEARLVTLGQDSAEVAHEALIREWPQLREWLSQDREGIILHRRLTEASQEWELLERDADTLYRGARLAQANEWSALNPNALNAQERVFLEASNMQSKREEQEREQQRERELAAAKELAETQRQSASRLQTRNRIITTVASVAVILALLAGRLGLRAENKKQLAISRELALASLDNLDVDPELSILLALEAFSSADTREAQEALHQAVQTSRVQFTLPGLALGVAYSPDGTRLAIGGEGPVQVLDAETGQELLKFEGNANVDWPIIFSPDGTRLATGDDKKLVKVWDAATGKELLSLSGHSDWVHSIAFSPDGTRIATGSGDKTAKVWDAGSGHELLTISDHTDVVSGVAFSPDGKKLITGSWDNTVKIRDAETGQVLVTPQGDARRRGFFSPDGTRFVTVSSDANKMWDAATGQELFAIPGGDFMFFTADGRRLVTEDGSGLKVSDAATGEALLTVTIPGGIHDYALSPDGIHASVIGIDGTTRVVNLSLEGGRELFTLAPHGGDWVRRVRYSPDGTRLATAGMDGIAKVFDAATGDELLTLSGHTDSIFGLAYSPDGTRLATVSYDKTVKVWDAASGQLLLTLSRPGHGDGIYGNAYPGILDVAFNADGTRLASAGADGTAVIWDIATGAELFTLSGNGAPLNNIAFSPDGLHLVTNSGEDGDLASTSTMWDLTTGKVLFTTPNQPNYIFGLTFSIDGTHFLTGAEDGVLRLWDAVTGKLLRELPGHTGVIVDITFSADGKYIATAGFDGIAKLWDTETGRELLTLTGHTGGISGVSFSPDGERLATSSEDGTVRVYLLNIEELITLAKSRLTRSLTPEECQKYLHVDTCPVEP